MSALRRTMIQAGPFAVLVTALVGIPLILLATYSFRHSTFLGVGGGPTLEQYEVVFKDGSTIRLILRTFGVAVVVAVLVTALAFVIAYALTFRLRGRRALVGLGVVVATGFAAFLVRIFAWSSILGNNGLVNKSLEGLGLIHSPLHFLFLSYFAVGVTMTYLYLPLAVLVMFNSMQKIARHTVEASRDLGAGRWRTLAAVVVPQARFGIIATFSLSAILACGDYVTPRLVGGPRGITIGADIEDLALGAGDLPGAAALALSTVAAALVLALVLLLLWRVTRSARRSGAHRIESFAARLGPRLPTVRRSLSVPITMVLLVYLTVPTLLVILFSLSGGSTTGLPIPGLTARWYSQVIHQPGFSTALHGSLVVASVAVVFATAIGVPVAFALARAGRRTSRILWSLVVIPFAMPPVLLGSALLITAGETGIQLGIAFTIVVHVMLLVSEIVVIVFARLQGMEPHLVEAARDLGASVVRALRTVTVPILLPAIVGAMLLAVAFSLDELFVTTFTIGPDNTLPIWLFGQARRGFTPGIDALGVMLLVGTLGAFALAVTVARKSVLGEGAA